MCLRPVGVDESVDLIRALRLGLGKVPDHVILARSNVEVHACRVVGQVSGNRYWRAFIAGVRVEWVAAILAVEPSRRRPRV